MCFKLKFYLCVDDDLVNKWKIWLFKAFRVILGWSLWILKYIKMHIFGLVFILYFLKLSAGKVLWFHLQTTDFIVYKHAIRLERISKKVEKCKLDNNFLSQSRDTSIIPNFINFKKLKLINKRSLLKFSWKLLYDEISNKHKNLKELCKQQHESQNIFKSVAPWMKQKCITKSRHARTRVKLKMACKVMLSGIYLLEI